MESTTIYNLESKALVFGMGINHSNILVDKFSPLMLMSLWKNFFGKLTDCMVGDDGPTFYFEHCQKLGMTGVVGRRKPGATEVTTSFITLFSQAKREPNVVKFAFDWVDYPFDVEGMIAAFLSNTIAPDAGARAEALANRLKADHLTLFESCDQALAIIRLRIEELGMNAPPGVELVSADALDNDAQEALEILRLSLESVLGAEHFQPVES